MGGAWKANTYRQTDEGGCEIELEFEPNKQVDAKKIGLIQSNARVDKGTSTDAKQKQTLDDHEGRLDQLDDQRRARGERTTGTSHIDRSLEATNPIYGAPSPKGGDISKTKKGKLDHSERAKAKGKMQNYQLGHNYKSWGRRQTRSAMLYDAPFGTVNEQGKTSSMHFEVTAVALSGAQKGAFYGAVRWGYDSRDGTVTLLPLQVVSMGTPTQEFMEAGQAWNQAHGVHRNEDFTSELTDNLVMPTTGHATLGADDMNDRTKVTAAIGTLRGKLAQGELDSGEKANVKFELKYLEKHLQTL
jgi:hypothetical protein